MNYLELLGTLVGLIYLYLEYRASIYLWIVGVIMPAIYIGIYHDAGLYADMGINIYYLLAAVYGWMIWMRGKQKARAFTATANQPSFLPIRYTPLQQWKWLLLIGGVLFVGIGVLLQQYTDSTVPWLDSFTTAVSIVGMWQLAHKYLEQWITWIVVDAVSCGLYIYKGLDLTAALYALYTVIAIFGYFKWKRMMHNTEPQQGLVNKNRTNQ
ncbi:MAG: nicotinamide riboside transporter PnuC [Bacteroidaceae bacterium]|nr:nicotinamide riboside transporter PnuC [Bacteroidaceae bacterium]